MITDKQNKSETKLMSDLLIATAPKTASEFQTEEDYHEFLDEFFWSFLCCEAFPVADRARMAESRMCIGATCYLGEEF